MKLANKEPRRPAIRTHRSSDGPTDVDEFAREFVKGELALHLLDAVSDAIFLHDAQGRFRFANETACRQRGYTRAELLALPREKLYRPEHRKAVDVHIDDVIENGAALLVSVHVRKDGSLMPVEINARKVRLADETMVLSNVRDITERKESEIRIQDLNRRLQERVTLQQNAILELSTPVIRVLEGIVVAPLVGALDSHRMQQFTERFLDALVSKSASVALVDITAVPVVDTRTAQHLIETFTAARLLGVEVILTGVRPAIARTLVQLGIDLSGFQTRSALADGLTLALSRLGKTLVSTASEVTDHE